MVARGSGFKFGRGTEHSDGMMQFDGEARFRADRAKRNLGALAREGFQPARRHPSAARSRYHQRAYTDDELDDEPCGYANGYASDGQTVRQKTLEQIGGVRHEYSNEKLGGRQPEAAAKKASRSMSAPPVRISATVQVDSDPSAAMVKGLPCHVTKFDPPSNRQVSRMSSEMKMARAASAAQYITSENVNPKNANVFSKAEIQELYSWLQTISLQDYLPVLLQMGIEQISHLVDLEEEDLQEAGMTRPERKRFLRKQSSIVFDDGLKDMDEAILSEDAASQLGERAFNSLSDLECVEKSSAPISHCSDISLISATSSCVPCTDREDNGLSSLPSIQQRTPNIIDLASLEQRAHAICRIQRISDDFDLGFGFLHTIGDQPYIVTCSSVLGGRESAIQALAVFSGGDEIFTCRLDPTFWCTSAEIGYSAVGAIFERNGYTSKIPDAVVHKRACKGDERVVMCHWGEVDKQFTIHMLSCVTSNTLQFPVRAGIRAASGTPIFLGDKLLGLSSGDSESERNITALRADTIIRDLKRQAGSLCIAAEGFNADTKGSKIICRPGENRKCQTSVKVPSTNRGQDSIGNQDSACQSRRPLRPVNTLGVSTLPSLSLPCMSRSNHECANLERNSCANDKAISPNQQPVHTFNVVTKPCVGPSAQLGVALSFQDQASENPGMKVTEDGNISTESESPQVQSTKSSSSPLVCSPCDTSEPTVQVPESEKTASPDCSDEANFNNDPQPSEHMPEAEPLSARSFHEPDQANDIMEAVGDSANTTNARFLLESDETKRILSQLLVAGVGEATQILARHNECPIVAHAAFQRLDELCSDSENRRETLQADTVTHVLHCLNTYEATVDSDACALSLLSSLSFLRELQFLIAEKDGIDTILRIMKSWEASAKVQFRACRALCNIGYESGDIQLKMVGKGCIPTILSAMERFLSSHKVQAEGCGVLCNLAANNDSNFKLILEHGGLSFVVQAMSMHGSQANVLYKGCCALSSLTVAADSHVCATDQGVASTVIKSMLMHQDNFDLLYKGCGVLTNLAHTPSCAATVARQGGVAAIVKALTGLTSDVKLQSKGLRALYTLSKISQTHAQMFRQGAIEATIKIMTMHDKEDELHQQACAFIASVARNGSKLEKTAWHHPCVDAIICAITGRTTNESVLIEGTDALAALALYEGVKDKIIEASVLTDVHKVLAKRRVSASVHAAVQKLERALYPLDSFLAGEAPDTRDAVRRSKVVGDQRPISAMLQAGSRPPRPSTATALRRSRRPASATFASGSGAMLVKDLRRGLGKEMGAETNLMLQHQIATLRNEAEALRHENLKMMTGAADSIAVLRDVHGVEVNATIKKRPVTALRRKSPSAAKSPLPGRSPYLSPTVSSQPNVRPPSGKSIRVSKEGKGNLGLERCASRQQSPAPVSPVPLEPPKQLAERQESVPIMGMELAAVPVHVQEVPAAGKPLERSSDVLHRIHHLIGTGRTNEQVMRHFSLIDFGISTDEVEACREQYVDIEPTGM